MDKSIIDICYTNGNNIVMLSSLLLLGLSVTGLSLFEAPLMRTLMVAFYFIIIGQYSGPLLLNTELDLETKKTARNSLIIIGVCSFLINMSLLSIAPSYKNLFINCIIYSIPTILGFIIRPVKVNLNVSVNSSLK